MATEWYIEGLWMKNCNCDPGCPCDFNQRPTQGYCEGMVGMHITKGTFGDVDLAGITFAGAVKWPGALHEGNGEVQPIVDARATPEQQNAIFEILSGKNGDTLFEVVAYICPTVHEPIVAPIEFSMDLEQREARMKVGDGVLDVEIETLRGIDPPDPYQVLVRIPHGMEYTGPNEEAETAVAKTLRSNGAIKYDLKNVHSTLAYVRHGSDFRNPKFVPTVVEKAFA
jgi:hypothetical protein